jgi:crossover junction endodeoxyribonuclease RusA
VNAPAVTELRVVVHGTPAPQGSKRHVGRGILVESSAKVKPWREAVKWAVLTSQIDAGYAAPHEPFVCAIEVTVIFTLPKPASSPRTRRTYPMRRPDLDKLIRSTLDGIGESGLWKDDAQVVSLHAHKRFPKEGPDALPHPGAVIYVVPMEGS